MPQPRSHRAIALLLSCFICLACVPDVSAFGGIFGMRDGPPVNLDRLNGSLSGKVHDYTHNHGQDRRVNCETLGQRRNIYVYVPPKFDASKRYPLMIWLHGLAQDEKSFLDFVPHFDRAMSCGQLAKCIIVAPDGTINGRASFRDPLTLYLNSPLGRFEDYIMYDVWNLATSNYKIRPERESHVFAGASMGAFGAYNLGIKHKSDFGTLVGIMPPVNLRYSDCRGRYDTDFDPNCFQWADEYRPNEPIGRFACGLIKIRQKQVVAPVFGEGPDVVSKIAAQNPAEMIATYNVKPGELGMYAGYGQFDEFNFDAHAESFAAVARGRGLDVHTVMVAGGHHNKETGLKLFPSIVQFLQPRLAPYEPKD